MSIPQDVWIPESIEAAEALRHRRDLDAKIDAQYADPDFVEQKKTENLQNSPYGPYTIAYEEDIALEAVWLEAHWPWEENESLEQIQQRNTEWLYTSYIEGFMPWWIHAPKDQWLLTVDEWEAVIDALSQNNDISIIASIPDLDAEKKSQLMDALSYMDDPVNKEQFIVSFEQDFWSELWVEDLTDSQRIVFDQIGSNYILPLNWEVDKATQKKALDTALKTSLNQTIFWMHFDKNEHFKQLAKTIRDPKVSNTERFSALEKVHKHVWNDQGKKWWRRLLDKQMSQRRNALREAWLEEQFDALQEQLQVAQEQRNNERIVLLRAQMDELIETAEISSWEVFAGWDDEMLWEVTSSWEKQSK